MKRLFTALSVALGLIASGAMYPEAMTVTAIHEDVVVMEASSGNVFEMYDDGYDVGDRVAVIMFGNGTEDVTDDIILTARHAG